MVSTCPFTLELLVHIQNEEEMLSMFSTALVADVGFGRCWLFYQIKLVLINCIYKYCTFLHHCNGLFLKSFSWFWSFILISMKSYFPVYVLLQFQRKAVIDGVLKKTLRIMQNFFLIITSKKLFINLIFNAIYLSLTEEVTCTCIVYFFLFYIKFII